MTAALKHIRADVLDIAYEETGDPAAPAAILLHGFPYDVRAFDEVVPLLVPAGLRVLVPYLRGFGPTRFTGGDVIRSGQQAALAHDLTGFMDALGIGSAIVGGFDWGGRAACITAALWPGRVRGLVTVDGYNVQHLESAMEPSSPEDERSYWYQYYFHSERGRRALADRRDELCAFLWETWSPTWAGARGAFTRSAPSLHNPDFVDVVTHSYRHRFGLAEGDPHYQPTEDLIAAMPPISVPVAVLESGSDGVLGPSASGDRDQFTGSYEYALLPGTGHNVPQEAPREFADAVLSLARQPRAS